jgi:opacity protein-like surface antigen
MSQSLKLLTVLAALAAATPALAQSGEHDTSSSDQFHFSAFQYRPLRAQIEGGITLPEGAARRDLDSDANIGFGLTWQPTSHLPLAIRVDGMYAKFDDRPPLLSRASASLGTTVDWGDTRMWGGDVDAELDTLLNPWVRLYLLAGVGWYDRRDSYYQRQIVEGIACGWYFCVSGPFLASVRIGETSTGLSFEQNAGAGLEFSLGEGASFFVDARYVRFDQRGQRLRFVPIRIGLRF